jgi:hypothetical protein
MDLVSRKVKFCIKLNGLSIKSNVLCAFPTLLGRVLISDRTIQISDYINPILGYVILISGYVILISGYIILISDYIILIYYMMIFNIAPALKGVLKINLLPCLPAKQ